MLVNCPKCGFSQPQDQYCAKCGVDMQAYKPKPAPLGTRMLASPVLIATFAFALIFSGYLYIVGQQRAAREQLRTDGAVAGFENRRALPVASAPRPSANTAPARVNAAPAPPPSPAAASTSTISRSAKVAAVAAPARAEIAEETDLASLGGGGAPADDATAGRAHPVEVRVHYALAPRARLAQLVDASRAQSQFVDFGEFQMGTLRGIDAALARLDVMEDVTRKFETANGEQMWFVGSRDLEPIGLTTRLALRGFENGVLRGDIEILRSFHESAEAGQGVVQKSFGPGEFAVPAQSGLIILMKLPRVPQYDENTVTPTQFLRIFRMPDFKRQQSEFVMLIDFKTAADSARPRTAPAAR